MNQRQILEVETKDEVHPKQARRRSQINDAVKAHFARESPTKREDRLKRARDARRVKRAQESSKERARRLEKKRLSKTARRAKETPQNRNRRLKNERDAKQARRSNESSEERFRRLKNRRDTQKVKRATESLEDRARRLQKRKDARKAKKAKESLNSQHSNRNKKAAVKTLKHSSPKSIVSVDPDVKASKQCGMCLKDAVNAVFLPCGHIYCCWDCSSTWSSACSSTCPVCRQQVVEMINLSTQERQKFTFKKQNNLVDLGIPSSEQSCIVCGREIDQEVLCSFCEGAMHEACATLHDCESEESESESESEHDPEPALKRRKLDD